MKKLLTAAMLLCAVSTVFAQGVSTVDKKGFNKIFASYAPSSISIIDGGDVFSGNFHNFGLTYTRSQVLCKVPLYIEFGAGFEYLQKDAFHMYSVQVPVNIAYRLSLGKGKMHLTPYTGPYVRYNISGSQDGMEKSKFFDKGGYNRWQAGWQAGLAFSYRAFYVSAGYYYDFLNFADLDGTTNIANGFKFGIGVVF